MQGFERIYRELARRAAVGCFEPNADVYLSDENDSIVVVLEIAGAEAAELRVGLEDRDLIVFGARADRRRSFQGSMLMKEIPYGHFLKRIHMPLAVNHHGAVASYCDGMLVLRLPVTERAAQLADRTEITITVQRISI